MSTPTDQEMLDAAIAAEQKLLAGGTKAVYWGERRVFNQDLPAIRESINYYRARVRTAARLKDGIKEDVIQATFSQDRWYNG